MAEIKKLIFDWDNTLIPWQDKYNNAAKEALKDCKIAMDYHKIDILIQSYDQKFLSFKIETMAKYFNELYHRTDGYKFVTLWLKYLGKMSDKDSKLIETLEYLFPKYELIVLTNWFKVSQLNRLKNAEIDKYFKEAGQKFIPTYELSNYWLVDEYVRLGLGIGFEIKQFIEDDLQNENLVEIKTEEVLPKRQMAYAMKKK